ncbi:MAG: hypothetical protein JKY87_00840 [Mariprofundus sp.]|nr:hypothetical protein [Mariprofundus sp.]
MSQESLLPIIDDKRTPYAFSKHAIETSEVFDTYWRFAVERQAVFFNRLAGNKFSITDDPILSTYKFTNAYRVSDRVSQYLIRNVIYSGVQSAAEVFFRVILFKTFNKIETWESLEKEIGEIRYDDFSFDRYNNLFLKLMRSGQAIYSAAYMMPSGHKSFTVNKKHQAHLMLLSQMMNDDLPTKIVNSKTMEEAFNLIRAYPMIGDFLAYQYVTDLNYSNIVDFSEMEFTVPGPGAKDGIRKCFVSLGELKEADIIKLMAEHQDEEFNRLGLEFQSLWGRPLQLIDVQNLFCEVDKYSRVAHPNISGISGRKKIKQKFRMNPSLIEYWYPPKWGLNEQLSKL